MSEFQNGDGHAETLRIGGHVLGTDDVIALLEILQRRYPGALGGAMAELWTGEAYSVKAPGARR
jgi:hypothetical protein